MVFEVFEGEGTLVTDNRKLGGLTLKGVTRAPAGKAEADVTFDIDERGLLTVTAVEKTGAS